MLCFVELLCYVQSWLSRSFPECPWYPSCAGRAKRIVVAYLLGNEFLFAVRTALKISLHGQSGSKEGMGRDLLREKVFSVNDLQGSPPCP